jgi:hypothetical protein
MERGLSGCRKHRPYCPSLECNHTSTKLDIYLILPALVAVWLGSAVAVSAGSSLLAGSAWLPGASPPTRFQTNRK